MSNYIMTSSTLAALKNVLMVVDPNIVFDSPEQSGAISAIAVGNPLLVTSPAHGLSTNHTIEITAVSGTTQLNGNRYRVVRVDDDTLELKGVDGSSYGAYISGGSWVTKPLMAAAGFVSPADIWPNYQMSTSKLPIWIVAQDLSRPSRWQSRTAGTIDRLFYAEAMLLLVEGRLDTDEKIALGEHIKRGWEYATVNKLRNNLTLGMTGTQVGPYTPNSEPFLEPVFSHIRWGSKDYWGMYVRLAITQRMPMEFSK